MYSLLYKNFVDGNFRVDCVCVSEKDWLCKWVTEIICQLNKKIPVALLIDIPFLFSL